MRRAIACLGISFLAFQLVSCSRFRTARQCEALVEIVNDALAEVEAIPGRDPPTAAGYEAIAARYDRLAADLHKQNLKGSSLAKAVGDYRRIFVQAAQNARTFATALKNKDGTKLPGLRAGAAQQVGKEKLLARRIDALCHPHR